LQTDYVDSPPCKKTKCPLFEPKKTILIHWAIKRGKSYVIACLQDTIKPKQNLPITSHIYASTCSRCKAVAAKMRKESETENLLPPETKGVNWEAVTWESLGYPQDLIKVLTNQGWTSVANLRNSLLAGNDVSTISDEYADIILASLELGSK
jgi:hypothetical protein